MEFLSLMNEISVKKQRGVSVPCPMFLKFPKNGFMSKHHFERSLIWHLTGKWEKNRRCGIGGNKSQLKQGIRDMQGGFDL